MDLNLNYEPCFSAFYTKLTLHIYLFMHLFQFTGHCEMAKIKGFKKLGLDLVKIQVIPNFFKGYI